MRGLEKVTIALLLREPFFAHLLAGVNRRFDVLASPSLTLKDEQGGFIIMIDFNFWEQTLATPAQKTGALKSELLHLIFRHPLRAKPFEDRFLFNLAADLVVRPFLTDEEQLFPQFYKNDLLQKPSADVRDYYEALRQMQETNKEHPWLLEMRAVADRLVSGHQWWYEQRDQIETELLELSIQRWIDRAMQRLPVAAQKAIPDGLRPWLEWSNLQGRHQLDWRRMIRLFAARSSRTQLKNTVQRASKRYGTSPGIKIKRHYQIIVAIDVSGSISPMETGLFFREINYLRRIGAQILLVACDDQIRSVAPYNGQVPTHRPGAGGTDFTPVFQLANQERRYDALIYFTDGRAAAPEIVCRIPILWVITAGGIQPQEVAFKQLPGQKVKLPVDQ